eukprot:NODE_482_length_6938_cov_0.582541.p6 type:complete len:131 gc:universal NODE_482_length_6938_cov_0.582541:398-6(-)
MKGIKNREYLLIWFSIVIFGASNCSLSHIPLFMLIYLFLLVAVYHSNLKMKRVAYHLHAVSASLFSILSAIFFSFTLNLLYMLNIELLRSPILVISVFIPLVTNSVYIVKSFMLISRVKFGGIFAHDCLK